MNMKYSFDSYAETPSAKLVYTINLFEINPRELDLLVNKRKFDEMCKEGCANYCNKWSCPPYAPSYQDFSHDWKYIYLMFAQIELDQFEYIKNDYLKIKAANSILKSRIDKYLLHMSSEGGKHISTGSCRLCKPCRRKLDLPCAKPNKMTYSFEAMGMDVNALIMKCFDSRLQWYKRHCLPEYTAVVCGLLSKDCLSYSDLQSEFQNIIER